MGMTVERYTQIGGFRLKYLMKHGRIFDDHVLMTMSDEGIVDPCDAIWQEDVTRFMKENNIGAPELKQWSHELDPTHGQRMEDKTEESRKEALSEKPDWEKEFDEED